MVTTIRKNEAFMERGVDARQRHRRRAPRPASRFDRAKGDGEDAIDVDAQTLSDPRVVDRRSERRAEPGFDQEYLQRRGDSAAQDDDEQPVSPMPTPWRSDATAKATRQMNLLRLVADEVGGDRHRHQHEADREQDLIERACAIEPFDSSQCARARPKEPGMKKAAGSVARNGRAPRSMSRAP